MNKPLNSLTQSHAFLTGSPRSNYSLDTLQPPSSSSNPLQLSLIPKSLSPMWDALPYLSLTSQTSSTLPSSQLPSQRSLFLPAHLLDIPALFPCSLQHNFLTHFPFPPWPCDQSLQDGIALGSGERERGMRG
ncbi:hypothetical protein Q8A67_018668 [Cirrhinus molitorella]|uniref:Uncharacterized protein n=1 Tax=Cirrhinus molitorella TaxID=172907 RepID=A0AA88TQZ0_9TELE|nr:hypothetical protein Q8A67_018668 [Cirrhinus molitorella]